MILEAFDAIIKYTEMSLGRKIDIENVIDEKTIIKFIQKKTTRNLVVFILEYKTDKT